MKVYVSTLSIDHLFFKLSMYAMSFVAPNVVFSSAIFSKTERDIFLTFGLSIRPKHFLRVFFAIQTYEGVASVNSA